MKDSRDCVEELPCDLTDEELLEHSAKCAELYHQRDEVEISKKQAVTDFGLRLKKIDGEIHLLSNNIRSKKETRNVQCTLDYDWPAGKKVLTRLDVGEVVSEEVISDYERQQHMNFVEKKNEEKDEEVPEEIVEETPPESTEETEEGAGQEDSGDDAKKGKGGTAMPEEEGEEKEEDPDPEGDGLGCFATYSAEDDACGKCGQSKECQEATPEDYQEPAADEGLPTEGSEEEVVAEEKSKEEPSEKTTGYKCLKCEEFFDEPKETEDDETECPLCGTRSWY